jgi:hypothetical protein
VFERDVDASGNWQLIESTAFGVGVWGCTDSTAWNYDSTANFDDGSCHCENATLIINTNNQCGSSSQLGWAIYVEGADTTNIMNAIAVGGYKAGETYIDYQTYNINICLPPSCGYTMILYDQNGHGWNNCDQATATIVTSLGDTVFDVSGNCCSQSRAYNFETIPSGCTDSTSTIITLSISIIIISR